MRPALRASTFTERSSVPVDSFGQDGATGVAPADRLAVAAAIMRRAGVNAVAVVFEGEYVGEITFVDILGAVADGLSTDAIAVAEYMRPLRLIAGAEGERGPGRIGTRCGGGKVHDKGR
jgi:hypothetical protein